MSESYDGVDLPEAEVEFISEPEQFGVGVVVRWKAQMKNMSVGDHTLTVPLGFKFRVAPGTSRCACTAASHTTSLLEARLCPGAARSAGGRAFTRRTGRSAGVRRSG